MRFKLISALLFCFIIFTLMGTQCNKYEFPPRVLKYDFTQKIILSPYKKQYKVNDTIWISLITSSKILFDTKSGQQIGVDSIFLPFSVNMTKWYPSFPNINPSLYCEFITPPGLNPSTNNYNTGITTYFSFGCDNNPGFTFRSGVVLKGQGVFRLELGNTQETGLCNQYNFSNTVYSQIGYTYDLTDCNKDVFLSLPPSPGNVAPMIESQIDKKKTFIIEVQ